MLIQIYHSSWHCSTSRRICGCYLSTENSWERCVKSLRKYLLALARLIKYKNNSLLTYNKKFGNCYYFILRKAFRILNNNHHKYLCLYAVVTPVPRVEPEAIRVWREEHQKQLVDKGMSQ